MADKRTHLVPLDGRSMLARALRSRRAEARLTQDQVAEILGVKGQTVRAWEREPAAGHEAKRPQARHWARLADFLGLVDADAIGDLLAGHPVESLGHGQPQVDHHSEDEEVDLRRLLSRLGSGIGPLSDAEAALAHRLLDILGVSTSGLK